MNAILNYKNKSLPIEIIDAIQNQIENDLKNFLGNVFAKKTLQMYKIALTQFSIFCKTMNIPTNEISSAVAYITYLAGTHSDQELIEGVKEKTTPFAFKSIQAKVASLNAIDSTSKDKNLLNGIFKSNEVKTTLSAISKTISKANNGKISKPKEAIDKSILKELIGLCDTSNAGTRDKALFLTLFTTASRQSEIVRLKRKQIKFTEDGINLDIYMMKTNELKVKYIPIDSSAYGALTQWLELNPFKKDDDFIFCKINKSDAMIRPDHQDEKTGETIGLSDKFIERTLKSYLEKIYESHNFGTHSFRRGVITELLNNGIQPVDVMDITGHRKIDTVMGYRQELGTESKNAIRKVNVNGFFMCE